MCVVRRWVLVYTNFQVLWSVCSLVNSNFSHLLLLFRFQCIIVDGVTVSLLFIAHDDYKQATKRSAEEMRWKMFSFCHNFKWNLYMPCGNLSNKCFHRAAQHDARCCKNKPMDGGKSCLSPLQYLTRLFMNCVCVVWTMSTWFSLSLSLSIFVCM